jgi:hypothetical protein
MITLPEFSLFWLGIATISQLIFIWIVFGRLAFYKEEVLGNIDLPSVSVIVAARNEYENLQELLPALLNHNSPDWLRGIVSRYKEKTEFVLGFSQYTKEKGFLNKFIRFETFFVGVQYLSFAIWGRPYMGVGRNLSYKKEVFFRHKGFLKHQHITGGDDDLMVNMGANRKNTVISIHEDSQTNSIPENNFDDWYHQKKRHLSVGKQYKSADVFVLGLLMISYIGFYAMLPLALISKVPYEWVLGAYGIRLISLLIVFQLIKQKLNKSFEIYLVPFMDILYIFYYIFVGIVARTTKRIAWRK